MLHIILRITAKVRTSLQANSIYPEIEGVCIYQKVISGVVKLAGSHLIGVFDSGVGGLTVVNEIWRQLPEDEVIYFGDTKHVPYGSRPVNELVGFASGITEFLLQQGAQVIVVACNTSASVSLANLQNVYRGIPIIGVVEPGARAALHTSRNGRIGVIATEATVKSGSYRKYIQELDNRTEVFMQACPLFVPLVEAGVANTEQAKEIAKTYLKPLKDKQVDTLILGCTHYPYLSSLIQEIMGPWVSIVDPAQETVRDLGTLLQALPPPERSVPAFAGSKPAVQNRFYVSGAPDLFAKVGNNFLGGLIDEVFQVDPTPAEVD